MIAKGHLLQHGRNLTGFSTPTPTACDNFAVLKKAAPTLNPKAFLVRK
jgi:hypothetical protein